MVSMRKYDVSLVLLPVYAPKAGVDGIFMTDWLADWSVCNQEAIEDLEYLRRTTPEEANVIFQLAKVYRLLGDQVKSAQTLAVARDVSPKSMNKIRKLLETVKDELDEG